MDVVSKTATNRRDKYHIRLDGNIIRYLNKNTWRHRGGGGYKYFVNCDHLASHPDLLQLQSFVYYKDHIAILHAAVSDPKIVDEKKEVIIKIDFRHDTVQKEYDIGEVIFRNHIPGFIRYICVFSCYDTTNKDIQKASKTIQRTLTFPTKQYLPTQICQAEPNVDQDVRASPGSPGLLCPGRATLAEDIEDDKENVLIMPYFPEGSIENYEWTEQNIQLLPNLLIHMMLSLAVAFDKVKFLHNDLHLGNILLKTSSKKEITYTFKTKSKKPSYTHTKTKRTNNTYRNYTHKSRDVVPIRIQYPTMGYQSIIMDYGKSKIGNVSDDNDNSKFWDNIYFLCTKIVTLRSNTNIRRTSVIGDEASHKPCNYFIDWDWDEVKKYIIQCIRENTPCTAVIPLIHIIEKSSLRYVNISSKIPIYNPNIV